MFSARPELDVTAPNVEPPRTDEDSSLQSKTIQPVAVEGRKRIVVSETSVVSKTSALPRATRTCTVECASGERDTDAWTGVPIAALVEAADFPGGTTYLRAEADDFAAEVPIRAALDGLLAFDREEGDRTGLPRLMADDIQGERLVKRVRRLAPVELAPREDPYVG